MRSIILAALGLMIAFATPAAAAMTLDAAKAQGVVGERADGLVGAVGSADAEISALIATVNKERLERYAAVAAKNGTDVTKVQAVAGQKLIENTPAGQYVQDASGRWVKR
jgi:hypothetical protein